MTQGRTTPARDVPVGTSWLFTDHPSMAEIMQAERDGSLKSDCLSDHLDLARHAQGPCT